jgi:predicted phosphatase
LQDSLRAAEQRGGEIRLYDDTHDLAQAQGRDGEVVTTYAEYWQAEQHPDDDRQKHGDRHCRPVRQVRQRV